MVGSKRERLIAKITLLFYLISSLITLTIFLFPKLAGAKFYTAIQLFSYRFQSGEISGALSPETLLTLFMLLMITNLIIVSLAVFRFNKNEGTLINWLFAISIFLIIIFIIPFSAWDYSDYTLLMGSSFIVYILFWGLISIMFVFLRLWAHYYKAPELE